MRLIKTATSRRGARRRRRFAARSRRRASTTRRARRTTSPSTGKKVAYVPVAMGFDLTEGWAGPEGGAGAARHHLRHPRPELEHGRRCTGDHRADLREAGRYRRAQSRRPVLRPPAEEGGRGRNLRRAGQHAVELFDRRVRRRRLCRHGRADRPAPGRGLLAVQGRQRQGGDHPGRADGGGLDLPDAGHQQRPVEASGDPARLQPGGRLGFDQGEEHRRDRHPAASGPVRHHRLLGRHGQRHRRGDQGIRQERLPADPGRRQPYGLRQPRQRHLSRKWSSTSSPARPATWRR